MGRNKGFKHSKEFKKHLSRVLKGHKVSKETKKKIGISNSISLKGNIPWNKGMKKNYKVNRKSNINTTNPPHKDCKHSNISKKKISDTKKRLYKEGKIIPYNKGKQLSEKTKLKIGKSNTKWYSKKCKFCKKIFKPRSEQHKFCSTECFGLWNSEINNYLWEGGKSFEEYPKGWNKIRNIIRKRDKFVCKICGIKQKYLKSKLCVHHIDENKQNISKNNLVSVCRQCHTRIHRRGKNGD